MSKEKKPFFRVEELQPGIFALAASAVRMFLLVGNERALLVDTGYGFVDPHETIRKITNLPFLVVNSHGHFDHAGGNHFFPLEPVYLNSVDIDVVKRHTSEPMRKAALQGLKLFQRLLFWLPIIPKDLDKGKYVKTSDPTERYLSLKEGDSFELGGLTARILELPGHTGGSIGVLIPERHLFITSDAANPGTWLFLNESRSLDTYRNTLRKIASLEWDGVLTGHSSRVFSREEFADWVRVAENPDWEHGKRPKQNPYSNSSDIRICREKNNRRNRACLWLGFEQLNPEEKS